MECMRDLGFLPINCNCFSLSCSNSSFVFFSLSFGSPELFNFNLSQKWLLFAEKNWFLCTVHKRGILLVELIHRTIEYVNVPKALGDKCLCVGGPKYGAVVEDDDLGGEVAVLLAERGVPGRR